MISVAGGNWKCPNCGGNFRVLRGITPEWKAIRAKHPGAERFFATPDKCPKCGPVAVSR